MQLVISFDDTGSMASCIKQVRSEIKYLCKDLFDIVPNLEIALIAHNDYCDDSWYICNHVARRAHYRSWCW